MFIELQGLPGAELRKSDIYQTMSRSSAHDIPLLRSFRNLLLSRLYKHFVPPGLFVVALIFFVLMFADCQTKKIEPVALAPDDMCSFCKMALSEKQYAAELIDSDGQVFKFDDIGCLLNFIRKRSINVSGASLFVMDFNQRQWIKADNAYYVRSSDVTTPMNGGIIAFKDQANAQEAVGKYHGKLLRFGDLTR